MAKSLIAFVLNDFFTRSIDLPEFFYKEVGIGGETQNNYSLWGRCLGSFASSEASRIFVVGLITEYSLLGGEVQRNEDFDTIICNYQLLTVHGVHIFNKSLYLKDSVISVVTCTKISSPRKLRLKAIQLARVVRPLFEWWESWLQFLLAVFRYLAMNWCRSFFPIYCVNSLRVNLCQ